MDLREKKIKRSPEAIWVRGTDKPTERRKHTHRWRHGQRAGRGI